MAGATRALSTVRPSAIGPRSIVRPSTGRPPIAQATIGPVMVSTRQATIGPVTATTGRPPNAPVAALIGVAVIGLAAAPTVAERIRGNGAERPTSLIVAPSALAL